MRGSLPDSSISASVWPKSVIKNLPRRANPRISRASQHLAGFPRSVAESLQERARRCQTILDLIDDTIESVRNIGTELRPAMLDELGLVAAVEWAAGQFEKRTGTKCTLELPREDLAIESEVATALFRILQEALANIARHAEATEFSVRLAEGDGGLRLEVHDNGKGFNEAELAPGASLGIVGMRERTLLLGGQLNIGGSPGEGTTITALIPRPRKAHA